MFEQFGDNRRFCYAISCNFGWHQLGKLYADLSFSFHYFEPVVLQFNYKEFKGIPQVRTIFELIPSFLLKVACMGTFLSDNIALYKCSGFFPILFYMDLVLVICN